MRVGMVAGTRFRTSRERCRATRRQISSRYGFSPSFFLLFFSSRSPLERLASLTRLLPPNYLKPVAVSPSSSKSNPSSTPADSKQTKRESSPSVELVEPPPKKVAAGRKKGPAVKKNEEEEGEKGTKGKKKKKGAGLSAKGED